MNTRLCGIRVRSVSTLTLLLVPALLTPPARAQVTSVVKLVSTPNTLVQGQSATLAASVNWTATAAPTGTITVTDTVVCSGASTATVATLGTIALGSATSASPGAGTLAVSSFPCVGDNSIVAMYGGDSNYSAGTSQPLLVTVLAGPTSTSTILSSSLNPAVVGHAVTLSAQVRSVLTENTFPTGAVTFTDTSTGNVLGTANLQTSGSGKQVATIASIATSSLTAGSYAVQAAYLGNNIYAPSTSQVLNQVVQSTASQPTLSAVTNGASYDTSSVAPGEILALFGAGMGPVTLTTYTLDANNRLPTLLAGTRVLINGTASPLLYTSDKQTAAVVPFGVAGQSTVQVQVEYDGVASAPVTVPVTNTITGIFSADTTGVGPGAILNTDFSYNSADNPAPPGSSILLYVTGLGGLDPLPPDGSIVLDPLPVLSYPPAVTIAGKPATIISAGPVPQSIAGLYQINCVIPADAATGASPVVVTADGRSSQPNLTVAIR